MNDSQYELDEPGSSNGHETLASAYTRIAAAGIPWFLLCHEDGLNEYIEVPDTEEYALYEKWHIVTRAAPSIEIYTTLLPLEGQRGNIDVWSTKNDIRFVGALYD
jgi:hypothetical protein